MSDGSARIAIVGAGIGGLTAAIALRRQGFAVEVYERATQLLPLGAGITLQPNALVALARIGLSERIERAGARIRVGALMRTDGTPLTRMPPEVADAITTAVGAPIVGMHRATLHDILLDELGEDALQLGRACTGYSQDQAGVHVHFADGRSVVCDVLIGADGIHSAVRAQLLGDAEPVYAGYTSWRGIADQRCGLADDFGGEMWGRGQRFGGCVIDQGRFYWFAVANAPEGQRDPEGSRRASLLARFQGWGGQLGRARGTPRFDVRELIEHTPEHAILRTDVSDRPPAARWGEGRVSLLGDAAHPMTPNLGQGACQAIEDALVLSRALASEGSLEAGLRAYEAARRPRANAVVLASRRLGAIAQWEGALACALRDALFGILPVSLTERQLLDSWRLPY